MTPLNRYHAIEHCRHLAELCADMARNLDVEAVLTAADQYKRAAHKFKELEAFWTPAVRGRVTKRVAATSALKNR
jgi:hypothetical protein